MCVTELYDTPPDATAAGSGYKIFRRHTTNGTLHPLLCTPDGQRVELSLVYIRGIKYTTRPPVAIWHPFIYESGKWYEAPPGTIEADPDTDEVDSPGGFHIARCPSELRRWAFYYNWLSSERDTSTHGELVILPVEWKELRAEGNQRGCELYITGRMRIKPGAKPEVLECV